MERIKMMKENLISAILSQMNHLETVDTKELGEAADILKDLSEFCYYETVTEAMKENKDHQQRDHYYYTERYIPYEDYRRDEDWRRGRMYYDGRGGSSGGNGGSNGGGNSSSGRGGGGGRNGYEENGYPREMRDYREGRSPARRRYYMEAKENHSDKSHQMKELESYMSELSSDITEMIADASQDEKVLLKQKLQMLNDKIV